jgi:hypothetical protein
MKIRQGFISNSSSSSFILRGSIFTRDEIIDALNIRDKVEEMKEKDEIEKWYDSEYDIVEYIQKILPKELKIEPTGNLFEDSLSFDNIYLGKSVGRLEDGGTIEIKDPTEEKDKEIFDLYEKIGLNKPEKLHTYVQMISNDNY